MYKNIFLLLLLPTIRGASWGPLLDQYWSHDYRDYRDYHHPLRYDSLLRVMEQMMDHVKRFLRENSKVSDIELVEHTLKWKLHLSKDAQKLRRDVRYYVTVLPLDSGSSGVEKIQTTVTEKELLLKQLSPCRRYKIQVEPQIKLAPSSIASHVKITLLMLYYFMNKFFAGTAGAAAFVESGKEQTPYDVHNTHQGQTYLILRWSAPNKCSRADNITLQRTVRYSIKAWRGGSDGKLETSLVHHKGTTFELGHLEQNTVYQVEITVQAPDGSSSTDSVTWVGSTAAQLPVAPQDVEVNINQTNVHLTWRPTSEAVGAHKINCRSSDSAAPFAAITNAGQNSLLVHEPPLRGNVTCHIRGSSEAGYGPPAEVHFRFLEQHNAADTSLLRHVLYAAGVLCLIAAVAVLILCLRRMVRRRR